MISSKIKFGINKHKDFFSFFKNIMKLHEPVGRVQLVVFEKLYECLFIPNCERKIM